ncbi:MAG: DUF5329 family protein [Spartobacteria bacterium]
MKYFTALVVALALSIVPAALAAESLDQTINYLLEYIAESDAVFIRNGSNHTGPEAVEHIKAKYEHFKKEVKTPEDFIRLSASKSLLSGKPYLVHPKGGKEQLMSEWLTEALKEHRAATHE